MRTAGPDGLGRPAGMVCGMTKLSSTPAPARTDVVATVSTGDLRKTRLAGLALAGGTIAWATANLLYGFEPTKDSEIKATDLTGLLFQLGVFALLHVQIRTRATGVKPISRRLLQVERVLLSLAMVWSVLHALVASQRDAVWMHSIDMFWPMSMLGMFFIGIKVAVAGRWRGPARLWSLLAETWAPVTVPLMGALGHDVADKVGALHLLLGYTVLGVILVLRPDLTEEVER